MTTDKKKATATATTGPVDEWVEMTGTSLRILKEELPLEAWGALGEKLGRWGRGVKWYIGDWLLFGEAAYGERHAQMMDATGYELATLTSLQWVAKRVAPKTRREDLSWSHHQEVGRFDSADVQALWLQRAVDNNWTQKQLRDAIQAEEGEKKDDGAGASAQREAAEVIITQRVLEALNNWHEENWSAGLTMTLLEDPAKREASFRSLAETIAERCVEDGVK